ncbi:MAG: M23 family metallopeptidase [Candidatus Limnocylindrales bacterium]
MAGVALVIVLVLGGGVATGALSLPGAGAHSTASGTASASASGSVGNVATPSPTASPALPTVRPILGAAPTSARGFKVRATVVQIGFPLPAWASYRYGPGWHAPRFGVPLPYESVIGMSPGGVLLRGHDGVDVQVKIGTPVLAAFSGIVIDPRTRWRPWAPQLYGNVVVIQSTEATSPGYYAINAHLSVVDVHIGETVTRGQVVGRTGITGDARGTIPHLHFELRAPFMIDQRWGGVFRRIDSFDPLPSLLAADPHRR